MAFQEDSIFWVEVEKVVPNPFQPRREFDEAKLDELADSIRMYGVLQPLTVTRKEVHNDDGSFRTEYELIAGERRWRASKRAGVAQVPVIIRSGDQTEQEKLELAIIENLQREDLNAVDRALAFRQLADSFSLSHAQVAKKVGRSREYVSNSIRLLALPEHMLDGLKRGDITEGHARTLLMLKDKPEEQEVVYREILLKKLSVREVERISRKIANDKVRKREYKDTDAHLIEIEKEFTDTLGTRVQILKTDFGGKLTIDYFSEDDLEQLLKAMKQQHAKINAAAAMSAVAISEQAEAAGETVIREMDELSESIAALEKATGITRVPESVDTTTATDAANTTASTTSTPTVATDTDEEAGVHTPNTGEVAGGNDGEDETDEEMATPEPVAANSDPVAPATTEEETTASVADDDTTQPVSEVSSTALTPMPDDAPVIPTITKTHSPTTEAPAAMSAVPGPGAAAAPQQSLRERLEAELARLDAAATGDATESTPSPDQAATAEETITDPVPETEKKDGDDDLYALRNFSL
jgi:ParB family chromosome partitioning protein